MPFRPMSDLNVHAVVRKKTPRSVEVLAIDNLGQKATPSFHGCDKVDSIQSLGALLVLEYRFCDYAACILILK